MTDTQNPGSEEQPEAAAAGSPGSPESSPIAEPAADAPAVAEQPPAPAEPPAPAAADLVAPAAAEAAPAEAPAAVAATPPVPVVPEPAVVAYAAPALAPYVATTDAGPAFTQQHPAQPAPARRRGWIPALAAGGVLGLVLGAAGGAGAGYLVANGSGNATVVGTAAGPSTITVNDTDHVNAVTAVATAAMASVVTINVTGQNAAGTGSGVVLDDQGHIVTNTHVVTVDGTESNPTIQVTTSAGRVYAAKVVGMDPLMDIAVIQVTDAQGLVPIEFADSSKLNVGETTVAIGAPLGLSGTVTSGIISALDRSIEVQSSAVPDSGSSGDGSGDSNGDGSQSDPNDPFNYFRFNVPGSSSSSSATSTIQLAVIQTDTAINPGNSGGALLDTDGKLIGINVAIATASSSSSSEGQSGSIGVGFAIPSNVVQRIADELISDGTATHGLLGASVADVADDPAQKDAGVLGASIVELSSGGAAEKAGLEVGDIITSVGGVPITGKTDATAQIRTYAAGSQVEIGYDRGGKAYTVEVTLGSLGS